MVHISKPNWDEAVAPQPMRLRTGVLPLKYPHEHHWVRRIWKPLDPQGGRTSGALGREGPEVRAFLRAVAP